MIRFGCSNCGHEVCVPEIHAGESAECPVCKCVIVIPGAGDRAAATIQADSTESKTLESIDLDADLFDIPPKQGPQVQPLDHAGVRDRAAAQVHETEKRPAVDEAERVPERKYPWLIDVFLYPTSKPGLTVLGILVGAPLFFHLLVRLLLPLALVFPPLLVFLVLGVIIAGLVAIVLMLYSYWYYCECIRNSAEGGLRAPETVANTPGVAEILLEILRVLACIAVFFFPASVYFLFARSIDVVFWLLLAFAPVFFPMGLLAVVVFDSVSALNPVLIVGSIADTFLPYLGLVLLFYAFLVLVVVVTMALVAGGAALQSEILIHVAGAAGIYLMMVWSHMLGRFYWRYRERLNWDV